MSESPDRNSPPPSAEHLERALPGDETLARSLALVRFLRERCPWDARQDPASLRPYLLEEAHEVADAILAGREQDLARELGDLLLNLAFQIVLAEERGAFDAPRVAAELERKMQDRHPHVYGRAKEPPEWESLKERERGMEARNSGGEGPPDPFDGVASGLEPLSRALRIQDRAAARNFDWPDARGAVEKLAEEIEELRSALAREADDATKGGPGAPAHADRIEEELGDLLFSAVNVCRLAGIHPSTALERTSAKFAARFRRVLELAEEQGVDPATMELDGLDRLWEAAKAEEKASG